MDHTGTDDDGPEGVIIAGRDHGDLVEDHGGRTDRVDRLVRS